MIGLVTAITNLAGTWVSAKAESTKATAEAKATALKTAAQSTADWERIMGSPRCRYSLRPQNCAKGCTVWRRLSAD